MAVSGALSGIHHTVLNVFAWKKGGIYPAEYGGHYLVQGELYAFVYDAQRHIRQ